VLLGFLFLATFSVFYSCKEEKPEIPSIISQERYAGFYEAFYEEFAGYDSNMQVIFDTLFYEIVNDTVLFQISTDSILLSGSNFKQKYVNNGNTDSVRLEKSYSVSRYVVHGYTRELDSLKFYLTYGSFFSTFNGEKL
jgi:hypothetical protein